MKRGPKWSNEGVNALLVSLKTKLESVENMDDNRLDAECAKRWELEHLVGKNKAIKSEALKEWYWAHTVYDSAPRPDGHVEKPEKEQLVNVDEKIDEIVALLITNGSATDGGIRNVVFKGNEKLFDEVMKHALKNGKVKRAKTSSGTEVITLP